MGWIVALLVVIAALYAIKKMADQINIVRVEHDRLLRQRGRAPSNSYIAKIKPGKSNKTIDYAIVASDETDALRQLLVMRIEPRTIVWLGPAPEHPAAQGPIPTR